MHIVQTPKDIQRLAHSFRSQNKIIGLIPTMGALHEGHLSLIRAAKTDCEIVILSIFVNPTQFGPNEDYLKYPKDVNKDAELAAPLGVDYIFNPSPEMMYTENYQTHIDVTNLSKFLCGISRTGHFSGVATVVCKLFNLTQAHYAYFGQKDYQQSLVIRKMVEDLNMPVQIKVMPIIREKDGLAMSSRNAYLDPDERQAALVLFKALELAKTLIDQGEQSAGKIRGAMKGLFDREELALIDYLAVCNSETLASLETILPGKTLIALAVKIGKTRLIDNILI